MRRPLVVLVAVGLAVLGVQGATDDECLRPEAARVGIEVQPGRAYRVDVAIGADGCATVRRTGASPDEPGVERAPGTIPPTVVRAVEVGG